MFYFVFLCFTALVLITTEGIVIKRFWINPKCEQPRGEVCVPIRQCPYFVELLARSPIPRPKHVIQAMREHQCGFHGDTPKVCCYLPSPAHSPENLEPALQSLTDIEPTSVMDHPNIHMLPTDCGPFSTNLRITGGSKASLFEFPWMALIVYKTEDGLNYRCGGTVISERYVVTAAHCIGNNSLAGVRLGEHNVNTRKDCDEMNGSICSPPVQDFYIEEVIVHASYNPTYFSDDIAIIRLATPADFSKENVKPICMPIGPMANTDLEGKFVTVAGWGVTESGYKSAKLLKVSVPIVSNAKCVSIYGKFSKISPKQICAGGYKCRDSCGGDSGGPLTYIGTPLDSMPRYIQYGIVSYGPSNCGSHRQPGVYTRLSFYMKWILDNMR